MLELPEVLNISKQLNENVVGKKVVRVLPPSKLHKFCWFSFEPTEYEEAIKGSKIISAEGFGMFVEVVFDNSYKLGFNDGTNVRLLSQNEEPDAYQLMIELDDGSRLVFTVAMYGGIYLYKDFMSYEYYEKSRHAVSPFSEEFKLYYENMYKSCKPTISAKAFLATEQHFPGIGNGVTQDILFTAGIHPKRKINSFSYEEKEKLFNSIINVLKSMTEHGGRDTEKNLFGEKCGYSVCMSKNNLRLPCPTCGGEIIKETYMGGSIYYCPKCQHL